jgi:hypothetical protein
MNRPKNLIAEYDSLGVTVSLDDTDRQRSGCVIRPANDSVLAILVASYERLGVKVQSKTSDDGMHVTVISGQILAQYGVQVPVETEKHAQNLVIALGTGLCHLSSSLRPSFAVLGCPMSI